MSVKWDKKWDGALLLFGVGVIVNAGVYPLVSEIPFGQEALLLQRVVFVGLCLLRLSQKREASGQAGERSE